MYSSYVTCSNCLLTGRGANWTSETTGEDTRRSAFSVEQVRCVRTCCPFAGTGSDTHGPCPIFGDLQAATPIPNPWKLFYSLLMAFGRPLDGRHRWLLLGSD